MAKNKSSEQVNREVPLLKKLHDGEIGHLERASPTDQVPILEAWEDLAGAERLVRENHIGVLEKGS